MATDAASRIVRLRGLPFFAAPRRLVAWIALVTTAWLGCVIVSFSALSTVRMADLTLTLAALGCATVCVWSTHREGEASGVTRDLLSAWQLPVAFLAPPAYAGVMVIPLILLKQHLKPGLWHRRVFTIAAVGLANLAASVTFHLAAPGGLNSSLVTQHALISSHAVVLISCGLAAGALGTFINLALIAAAAKLSAPELSWRSLFGDRESRALEIGEICLGLAVTAVVSQSLVMLPVMLPPVLLIQRSLTHTQLRAAARTDPKTGLLNAATWEEEVKLELIRCERRGLALAVLIIDLDSFKTINDNHGHLVGDQALRTAANTLRTGLRDGDILGRFGGEEFTLALPDTDPAEAYRVAERLRTLLGSTPTVVDPSLSVLVSASIGVAAYRANGTELSDLVTSADNALYRAKRGGRNRVEVAYGFPLAGDPAGDLRD